MATASMNSCNSFERLPVEFISLLSAIQANEKHHFELRSVEGNFKVVEHSGPLLTAQFTIEPHDEVEEWISLITNTLEESRKSMISTAFASGKARHRTSADAKHFRRGGYG